MSWKSMTRVFKKEGMANTQYLSIWRPLVALVSAVQLNDDGRSQISMDQRMGQVCGESQIDKVFFKKFGCDGEERNQTVSVEGFGAFTFSFLLKYH